MKKEKVSKYQNMVLRVLADKVDDFYLAGGTALSLFYFQHRISVDLDFFTHNFSIKRIKEIISYLKNDLKREIKLVGQALKKDKAQMQVYSIYFAKKDILKIGFVEDFFKLIKQPKVVDGIKILSLEDIFIRKLYALVGTIPIYDMVGERKIAGGRVEAKDFYDIYYLSNTFMSLSKFADEYTDATTKEGLINWFRSYDRMKMMDGILTLDIGKKIDCKNMERHFSREIDKIVEGYIEGI
ncbi:MAG: nucleotidyl transferase AbiEii/AbiGii toxin family protein [Candidatus Omnitrophica bacterium]|nr:nucleotidyl transferase AbiEii/AbiGii toxin family protein [Candidatus Omnitrophota bacterium]